MQAGTPLTEAQSGLWYSQILDPANPIFNTGQYLDLVGPLDSHAFAAAIDQLGAEAEALSLRFADTPDGPVQCVDPSLRPALQNIDLSDENDPEGEALSRIRRDMATPVDPRVGPIAAQHLYRLSPTRHLWALRVHHLANDGFGIVMLTSRVADLYEAAITGQPPKGRGFAPLEKLWAEDAAYRASDKRRDDADYWRGAMAGMEEVVGMAPGRAISAHYFHRHERPMAQGTRAGLLALAQSLKLGWPDVLTTLVATYCRRFTGTDEIVIGVPSMGRMGSVSARIPAMVMNVLPVRMAPDEDAPIADAISKMVVAMVAGRKHGRYRGEQLRRDLGLIGGARRLYGPLINMQPYDKPPHMFGLDVTLHVTGTGPVEDINFTFRGDGTNSLTLEVDANPNLYSAEAVAAHGERLAVFLARAVGADSVGEGVDEGEGEFTPAATLGDIPTATAEEAQAEIEAHNATHHILPDVTLAELIERAMVATPDAEALRFEGVSLSYAELDRRTQALAGAIRARIAQVKGAEGHRIGDLDGHDDARTAGDAARVTADVLVAVALPRSLELVIALVAVLRAGAAYLPLDLEHPKDRIATILESARPALVLAQDDPFGLYGDMLLTPASWPTGEEPSDLPDDLPLPQPMDAAYVIYTSGSTGTPKGVMVEHRAIVNRLLWMRDFYDFTAQDRILQKTPATFDVSVWEFFLSFISGGTLVVAPPGAHKDPAAIAALIRDEAITTLHFVPSMLAAFIDSPISQGITTSRIFCSGEELPADLRDRFHQRVKGELHNLYGPTEAAVDVSYWPASADDISRPVPIGFPVWNTSLILLDDRLRPVPQGVAGNLYLGGVQLARGYVGRPDLTAERFIADPFHPGQRLYMTGDLARRRPDGAVEYLGRSDHQVKIRGLRIELGEIESAIGASSLARSNLVLAKDGRLVAYVVPDDGYDRDALRAALAARLPDYMVPAAFVELDAMPVTANGKLDRKALPEPRFEGTGGELKTETQQRLAAIFAELLAESGNIDGDIGAQDDFFALGGDSLIAVRLLMRIEDEWGIDPGLAALFDQPDVASLSARIDALTAGDDASAATDNGLGPLITLARGEEASSPLFLIHPAGGICWGYRTLAAALEPRRMVYGLQSPALDPAAPAPDSINALAAQYAAHIREIQPHGPYHVAGWSVGGIIAQAVAVELRAEEQDVGLVALLDAYPADLWRAEPEPDELAALRALLTIAGFDAGDYPHLVTRDQIVAFLREQGGPLGSLPPQALDGVVRAVTDTNRLVRGHHHRAYDGVITHIRAGADHQDKPQLMADQWAPYVGGIEEMEVPFLHRQMTGPDASMIIGPSLSRIMAATEQQEIDA
ncbi:MAG: amino acid adenylation domain-containing protein [Sphingobium sp.]|nr:amino acid adenylation domain-containing protein [Sphingobium sp.]